MKDTNLRDTLARIQDVVAQATGAPLSAAAAKRVEEILAGVLRTSPQSETTPEFLSREVTILLTDLRGFTSVSEAYPVGVVLELLNRYLVEMSKVVSRHRGTIDKFMGDSIMVLFGAPRADADDVRHAVACAVDMQLAMSELNLQHGKIGLPAMYMGIGVNTGMVMAGLLGSDLYSEYTVIGDEVNLASRIEAVSLRGQVLISEQTHLRCRDYVAVGEPIDVYVKGKAHPVGLREVLGIPALGKVVPRQEMRRSPRIEVKLPFSYHAIDNEIVSSETRQAVTVDVGYYGLLVETASEMVPHAEIKLDLPLPSIDHTARDVYAKVVKTLQRDGRRLAALEFTSLSDRDAASIRRFLQLELQSG
jgi:adenylate cyclase